MCCLEKSRAKAQNYYYYYAYYYYYRYYYIDALFLYIVCTVCYVCCLPSWRINFVNHNEEMAIIMMMMMMITVICNAHECLCVLTTGILYYVSSTLNPILYSVMSHRYRRALHDTFCLPNSSADSAARRQACPGRFLCSHGDSTDSVRGYLRASRAGSSLPRPSTDPLGTPVEIRRTVGNQRPVMNEVQYSAVKNRALF